MFRLYTLYIAYLVLSVGYTKSFSPAYLGGPCRATYGYSFSLRDCLSKLLTLILLTEQMTGRKCCCTVRGSISESLQMADPQGSDVLLDNDEYFHGLSFFLFFDSNSMEITCLDQ